MLVRFPIRRRVFALLALACGLTVAIARSALAAADAPRVPQVEQALAALHAASNGQALVTIHPATGVARFVRIPPGAVQAATIEATLAEQANHFLAEFGGAFGLQDPDQELRLLAVKTDPLGATRFIYEQVYQGVPVFAGELRIHFDATGQLVAANGVIIPDLALNLAPKLAPDEAAAIAHGSVATRQPDARAAATGQLQMQVTGLVVFRTNLAQGLPGQNHLVYEVRVLADRAVHESVYVDAHSGVVIEEFSSVQSALQRRIYKNSASPIPGALVWQEGDPLPYADEDLSAQANINRVIDYSAHVYNFFAGLSGGSFLSWDGADAPMNNLYAVPSSRCPNAFWTGQAVSFCVHTVSDDLVAHEWAHGYTQSTHGLVYKWQPGALNEAYSDIWGETIDLINGAGTDEPDNPRTAGSCTRFTHENGVDNSRRWLLFEDARGFGQALRDLWNPACLGNPGKVSDTSYFCSTNDDGGVHTNSGIPNHAYALLVDGGTYNGQTIRGIGLTRAANIYWRAQTVYHTLISDFGDHADALEQACSDLVGARLFALDTGDPVPLTATETISTDDCAQVSNAIAAVELRRPPTQCRFPAMLHPNAPALCLNEGPLATLLLTDWESGLDGWNAGTRPVTEPGNGSPPDWTPVNSLPDGRTGSAAFADNRQTAGDGNVVETGTRFLESPPIAAPDAALAPRLAFDHWFATETAKDGGNVKISINDGDWTLIPSSAYSLNPYNGMVPTGSGPESAFTGVNYATFDQGSWGQSQLRLHGLVQGGDTFRLRFEFHQDATGGIHGWYVDDVHAYFCQSCGNGQLNEGEGCDDGNQMDGDGCSALCQVEPNWFCKDPVAPGTNRPAAPGVCTNLALAICSEPNLPIPDNDPAGATDTITVAPGPAGSDLASVTVGDLDVYVLAEHSWLGDLSIKLTKIESGRQAALLDRPGSQTPGAFGCSGDDMEVLFDDQSVLPAEHSCSNTRQPALRGNLLPGQGTAPGLSVFNGEYIAGQWSLTLMDHAVDELGTLRRWCLVPTAGTSVAPNYTLLLPFVGR